MFDTIVYKNSYWGNALLLDSDGNIHIGKLCSKCDNLFKWMFLTFSQCGVVLPRRILSEQLLKFKSVPHKDFRKV